MSTADSIQAIERAHQDGGLLVHMFESQKLDTSEDTRALCKVLHGDKGAVYYNPYFDVEATEDGYCGLATTSLRKGFPVPVWNVVSDAGFLFDAHDTMAVKPVHVSSEDAWSRIENGKLRVSLDSESSGPLSEVFRMQKESLPEMQPDGQVEIDFADKKQMAGIIATARQALGKMWEAIERMGWDSYIAQHSSTPPGLNEISVIAHMRGIKGIVVTEDLDHYRRTDMPFKQRFVDSVKRASHLSQFLHTEYGDIFPEPPPIFVYSPGRANDQLVALEPEHIENPEKFYLGRHHTSALTPLPASAAERITPSR